MAIELPREKVPAVTQDPRYLILFGLPKVGKTTVLSTLNNNLILDFEDGSDYIEALKIKIHSLKDLKETCKAIKDAGNPYKYITIDTITAVEEMVKPVAIQLYRNSPVYSDKYADVTDVALLPNGSGYSFWRKSLEAVIDLVSSCTSNLIICGHVKDVALNENLDGTIKDLDLTGKTKRILSAKSDAIGFVHRNEHGDLCINFGDSTEILTGARPAHLAGKDIVVAERNANGGFDSHWERIFLSEAK